MGMLGCQLVGIVVIIAWTCGVLGLFFVILHRFGWLRAPAEDETRGMDTAHHGGCAYYFEDGTVLLGPSEHEIERASFAIPLTEKDGQEMLERISKTYTCKKNAIVPVPTTDRQSSLHALSDAHSIMP
mmetsp:Transcript_8222/g.11099  ORF Transcript_8222/g.11099 Transcript_8222/m.11099 type:complete len:128 (-) Transcript_8222:91-474(-)